MEQAFDNIAAIVRAAGCDVTNVGRLTWFVTDKTEYLAYKREVGKAYQRVLGKPVPAMSLVIVNDLIEDEALVEFETTAYIAQD
jgi:enamine deaminase RidA (YjgF/YER057c/UK114 family)